MPDGGVVLADQLKCLDWRKRNVQQKGEARAEILHQVRGITRKISSNKLTSSCLFPGLPLPKSLVVGQFQNFCRVHQTLRVTPAMEAQLTDHVWSLQELVGLLEQQAGKAVA
jgi:hypothetical protein